MGHIQLSISDIEFVHDEIVLDDADVILIEERAYQRADVRRTPRVARVHSLRRFDDAETRVWCRAADVRAFR